jgi:hypothetical protein
MEGAACPKGIELMDAEIEMDILGTIHRLSDMSLSPWMRRYKRDVSYLLDELKRNRLQCNKCCHEPGLDTCAPDRGDGEG